jgi:hypothetical protein
MGRGTTNLIVIGHINRGKWSFDHKARFISTTTKRRKLIEQYFVAKWWLIGYTYLQCGQSQPYPVFGFMSAHAPIGYLTSHQCNFACQSLMCSSVAWDAHCTLLLV